MFAKFISETEIEIAPKNKGQWSNYDQNEALMKADGYIEVKVVEQPSDDKPKVMYRLNKGVIEQYTLSLSSQELYIIRRKERDEAINNIIWRVQRYDQQKQLGIQTTDSDETYMNILKYIQYLRDVPNNLSFSDINVLKFEEWKQKPENSD